MKPLSASAPLVVLLLNVCGAAHADNSTLPSMTDTAKLVGVTPMPTPSERTVTTHLKEAVKAKAKQPAINKLNALAPTTAEATAPTAPVLPSVQLPRPTIAPPAISGDNTNAVFNLSLGNLLNSRK